MRSTGVAAATRSWIAMTLTVVVAVGGLAETAPPVPRHSLGSSSNGKDATPARRPVKTPKMVKKIVGTAVTTLREAPKIVDRAAQVAAGRIRPCSEGRFVVDFETLIVENVANQLTSLVSGPVNQTPAPDPFVIGFPDLSKLFSPVADAADVGTEAIERALREFVRSHVIRLMYDEAQACPEAVERIVTTVITQLRPDS